MSNHQDNGRNLLEKGKRAERFVYKLAQNALLADWCYLNPMSPEGKELCDVLVIFKDSAILWQIKHVKVDPHTGTHRESDFRKNTNQLTGAYRKLMACNEGLVVNNDIRGKKTIYPSNIKNVHLVAAFWGDEEEYYTPFINKGDGKYLINVLDQDGIETAFFMLSTIVDFLDYLTMREKFFSHCKQAMLHGEADFLVHFLLDRSLTALSKFDNVYIPQGEWERFANSKEYTHYVESNKISEGWDDIIKSSRGCSEMITEELCSLDRLHRRILSKRIFEAMMIAANDRAKRDVRRYVPMDELGVTYCFLLTDKKKKERELDLFTLIYVCRGEFSQNKKVVGIAINKTPTKKGFYSFGIIDDKYKWTDKDALKAKEIKESLEILKNPIREVSKEDEF